MSEESILQESINPELLSEDQLYTVCLYDQANNRFTQEQSIKLDNPYEFDLMRFVPTDQCVDLESFFDLACRVIEDAQDRNGIAASQRISLVEDFAPEELHQYGDEVITWKVIKRKPANMDTKAQNRQQRGYARDYDLRFKDHPNKVIVVTSRPIDHIIEFSCWSKVSSKANKRALWLERLFIDQSWAFTSKGVERFFWQERGTDSFFTASGQRLYTRPLRFFVRLREFNSLAYPAIRNFNFEVTMSDHT